MEEKKGIHCHCCKHTKDADSVDPCPYPKCIWHYDHHDSSFPAAALKSFILIFGLGLSGFIAGVIAPTVKHPPLWSAIILGSALIIGSILVVLIDIIDKKDRNGHWKS